MTLIGTN